MASLAEVSGDPTNRATNRQTLQPNDIVLSNVDLSYSSTPILTGASVKFVGGRCYALLGRNGAGKSTLLRSISDRTLPGIPDSLDTYLVPQEVLPSAQTVEEYMFSFDDRMEALETALEAADSSDTGLIESICEQMSELEANFDNPELLTSALSKFGAAHLLKKESMDHLSGGERKRVALSVAALIMPRVLMLDEPTNHLDAAGIGERSEGGGGEREEGKRGREHPAFSLQFL